MPITARGAVSTRIDPKDLRELRRTFRAIKPDSPEWNRELGQAYKRAGALIAARAQARALGMSPITAKAAKSIRPSTTNAGRGLGLKITVSRGAKGIGLIGIFGAKRRTGWFSKGRYANSPARQHLPWVGANWQVGGDDGPYALNPAIGETVPEAMVMLADAIEDLMTRFANR